MPYIYQPYQEYQDGRELYLDPANKKSVFMWKGILVVGYSSIVSEYDKAFELFPPEYRKQIRFILLNDNMGGREEYCHLELPRSYNYMKQDLVQDGQFVNKGPVYAALHNMGHLLTRRWIPGALTSLYEWEYLHFDPETHLPLPGVYIPARTDFNKDPDYYIQDHAAEVAAEMFYGVTDNDQIRILRGRMPDGWLSYVERFGPLPS